MHAYVDTLIGPNNIKIIRGSSNGYVWSVKTNEHESLDVCIHKDNKTVMVDNAPNYVLADIMKAITFGSDARAMFM